MKKIIAIMILVLMLGGCSVFQKCPEAPKCPEVESNPNGDRQTFMIGCVTGATSASKSLHAPIPLGAVVHGCDLIYKNPKIQKLIEDNKIE